MLQESGEGICSYLGRSQVSILVLEKSQRRLPTEVIVAGETSRDCEYHTPEVSQNSEGLNVKFVPNSIGRFTDESLPARR